MTDPDLPAPGIGSLCGVFSQTANYNRGKFLAEAARMSFSLLERTSPAGGGETYAEFRLPLHAESGAWLDLERWTSEFGLRSPRVKWIIQFPQAAYEGLKERRSVLSFGELLEHAFGPPAAAAAHDGASEAKRLVQLLRDVSGFEVAAAAGMREVLGTEESKDPAEWTMPSSPPFAYQFYHVWARLKALNACRASASLPPLALLGSANTAEPVACAYLLGAKSVSRCAALAAHAPLRYLFILDGIFAIVSVASKRSLGGAGEAGVASLAQLFRSGVPVALCSEDPAVSSQHGDDALAAEYALARHALALSPADLAELSRNSVAASSFASSLRLQGTEEPVAGQTSAKASGGMQENSEGGENETAGNAKRTVRERYRSGRREAEGALVARLAPRAVLPRTMAGMAGSAIPGEILCTL